MCFGYPPNFMSIRANISHAGGSPGDPAAAHELPHHPQTTPDGVSRPSSDEGENEEREDNADKLDCLYSGYHPRPAAVRVLSCPQLFNRSDRLLLFLFWFKYFFCSQYCTFGSRLFGRGFYSFDRRWNRVRCALTTMMEKHVNSQMWKYVCPFPLKYTDYATRKLIIRSYFLDLMRRV